MKKIVLMPNAMRDKELTYTKKVLSLLQSTGFQVCMSDEFNGFSLNAEFFHDCDTLYRGAYAVVVLGGDGSILRAAENASRHGTPILAVNLGRLGFIAQLEKDDIPRIPEVLSSDFSIDERKMLSVSLIKNGEKIFRDKPALNDAVICKTSGLGMVELELSCNGRKVISYRADGVIAASATGSTAYSMSAGGPIIDSSLGIVEITPICAHSLKAKPIVFSGTSCLDITLLSDDCEAALSVDGAPSAILEKGDRLTVTVSDKTTKLISLSNNFCDVLYNKMNDK